MRTLFFLFEFELGPAGGAAPGSRRPLILISNGTLSFEMRTLRVRAAFRAALSHKNAMRFARSETDVFSRVFMMEKAGEHFNFQKVCFYMLSNL